MSTFLDNVTALIKEKGITKNRLLTDLNLSRNSFVAWKNRGTIPSAETVAAIAEYLEVPISTLLGIDEADEEKLTKFSEKLAAQMAYKNVSLSDLSEKLGVPVDVIFSWLKGDSDCPEYYDQLSEIFEVAPTYWMRPRMISLGIEPTMDEYLLIILYREYQRTGELKEDLYGYLRDYFPSAFSENVSTPIGIDAQLIRMIGKLSSIQQAEVKGYVRRMLEEPVAASPSEVHVKAAK